MTNIPKTIRKREKQIMKEWVPPFRRLEAYDCFDSGFRYGQELTQMWIPIDEELPPQRTIVLCKIESNDTMYGVLFRIGKDWYNQFGKTDNPTHWRQIELYHSIYTKMIKK